MALHASASDQAKLLELADFDVSLARTASQLRGLAIELSIETLEKATAEIKTRRHDAMVVSENIRSETYPSRVRCCPRRGAHHEGF